MITSTVAPLGGSNTPKESREHLTGPVQVSFPFWTLHSGWHGIHSPDLVANSRLSLHSGKKKKPVTFKIFQQTADKIETVGTATPQQTLLTLRQTL